MSSNSREPSDVWQDEYQEQFLTDMEEETVLARCEDAIEEDFQEVLILATQDNIGYKERSEDIGAIIKRIHSSSSAAAGYTALGEYLYLLVYDYAEDEAAANLARFE